MGPLGVCLLPNPITALEEVWVLRPHLQQLLCFPSEPWRRGPNESHSQKQVLSTTAAPPTETRLGASRSPDTHLFPEPCRCREEGTGRGNPALPSAPHPFAPHQILIAFAWNKCSDRSIPGYKNHRICSNLQCRCRGASKGRAGPGHNGDTGGKCLLQPAPRWAYNWVYNHPPSPPSPAGLPPRASVCV